MSLLRDRVYFKDALSISEFQELNSALYFLKKLDSEAASFYKFVWIAEDYKKELNKSVFSWKYSVECTDFFATFYLTQQKQRGIIVLVL